MITRHLWLLLFALFPALFLPLHPCLAAPDEGFQLTCETNRIGRYSPLEFTFRNPGSPANQDSLPSREFEVHITTPSGKTILLPTFAYQHYSRKRVNQSDWFYPVGFPVQKARFAPAELGQYHARGISVDAGKTNLTPTLPFDCVPSDNRGFLRVSKKDPRFLEFDNGAPFFAIGQNLAFIGDQQYVSLTKAEDIFEKLQENGANYLRIWTCCGDWAMGIESRKSAWGRSWDWRPAIVPAPGMPSDRKCLKFSSSSPLKVEPSHRLALKPSTNYRLAGRLRAASSPATIRLDLAPGRTGRAIQISAPNQWQNFEQLFNTGPDDWWLNNLSFRLENGTEAWLDDLSLKEAQGGPELLWEADVNHPVRGYYNPLDSFILDELLRAAAQRRQYIQVCLLERDLYMSALKNSASPEYSTAIDAAKKTFRYALARWAAFTSVGAWEYWNEMDPGLPTDSFYTALGEYLEAADPYRHLRTTSTWGPSAKDCKHPKLDIADTHFYLRPADKGRLDDEVHAVAERTRWLRDQAPQKPAHLGEFGLADNQWRITDTMRRHPETADIHNALWASALSGASGTALFWWWERIDQRNAYTSYRPISRFIADVPWTSGNVQPASLSCSNTNLRVVGLRAERHAWLWCFHKQSAWQYRVENAREPSVIEKSEFAIHDLPAGDYVIQWINTRSGEPLTQSHQGASAASLVLHPPSFTADIACRITPL